VDSLPANVRLDSASAYRWEDLNETEFIAQFFKCLAQELGETFYRYNFFIFSSQDPKIRPESADANIANKILFFISDESPSLPSTLALQHHYLCVFKSYLPCEFPNTNIFPFQLGYVKGTPHLPLKPTAERHHDIFFYGNLNSNRLSLYHALNPLTRFLPTRLANRALSSLSPQLRRHTLDRAIDLSQPNSKISFTDGFKQGLASDEYARLLHDSKIALCPRGFSSAETFRHIEAMRAGAAIVSEQLPDTFFYRGSPIITVPNWQIGLDLAKELLKQPDSLASIQAATIKWWEDICCERAAAKYVRAKIANIETATSTT
jgi:hypothetical protein